MMRPVQNNDALSPQDEDLLRQVAEGRPMKAIAVTRQTTAAAVAQQVEDLFLKLAQDASAGVAGSLKRLRLLHQAIVEREEQGETLSRLLPGGLAEKLRSEGRKIGETERLQVTVIMSDIRGYSSIAETADPSELAQQLNTHRAEMNHAILDEGGTVMQFVGDAVMAVFGAPFPSTDHAERALAAARSMHRRQSEVNERWRSEGLAPFGLGIGLSTGDAAAALLGSEERLEYTLVGDTVNLAARLQQWAAAGEIILSEGTQVALGDVVCEELAPAQVKGRQAVVRAFKIPAES
jgi:class 3 adenylate cyclase